MLTLDFTNQNKASNAKKGYFKQWNNLFGVDGELDAELGDGEDGLAKILTTKGRRSFASYFNSPNKLNRKTKWIFGDGDKFIAFNSMYLEQTRETEYQSYFLDNIFSLGNGTNFLYLDLQIDDDNKVKNSIRTRLRQKGLKFTILGGLGDDHVKFNLYKDGDSNLQFNPKSSFVVSTGGGGDIIEVEAEFKLGVKIDSGSGSDSVDLSEANSSFVDTSQNNDTVLLGRDKPWAFDELKAVKNIKDIIIGGSGRDHFIFNQNIFHSSAYTKNKNKDFCVLKDYESIDKIIFHGNEDLKIDPRNGKVKLAATGAYKAQSIGYTARLYADDDLIAYISGAEPSLRDILQYH